MNKKCANCKVQFKDHEEVTAIYEYVVEEKHGDYVRHKEYVHLDTGCAERRKKVLEKRAARNKAKLEELRNRG